MQFDNLSPGVDVECGGVQAEFGWKMDKEERIPRVITQTLTHPIPSSPKMGNAESKNLFESEKYSSYFETAPITFIWNNLNSLLSI